MDLGALPPFGGVLGRSRRGELTWRCGQWAVLGVPVGVCGVWWGLVGGCCSNAANALQCVYAATCYLLPAT